MDGDQGVELVAALQSCLHDEHPGVVALALEALASLCEQDVLDFYKAWVVVQRIFPEVPQDSLVAARWVSLLGCGAADGEAHLEEVKATMEVLWRTARMPVGQVREASYRAMSRYPLSLLETAEVVPGLSDVVALLLEEKEVGPRAAAEAVVVMALQYEHEHRRRYLMPASREEGRGAGDRVRETTALQRRLTHHIPTMITSAYTGGSLQVPLGGSRSISVPVGAALLSMGEDMVTRGGEKAGAVVRPWTTGPSSVIIEDALNGMAWRPLTHPGLALRAWRSCWDRLSLHLVSDEFLAHVEHRWSQAAPSVVVENCLLVVGVALASEGVMSEAGVTHLVTRLMDEVELDRSSPSTAAALLGLVFALPHLPFGGPEVRTKIWGLLDHASTHHVSAVVRATAIKGMITMSRVLLDQGGARTRSGALDPGTTPVKYLRRTLEVILRQVQQSTAGYDESLKEVEDQLVGVFPDLQAGAEPNMVPLDQEESLSLLPSLLVLLVRTLSVVAQQGFGRPFQALYVSMKSRLVAWSTAVGSGLELGRLQVMELEGCIRGLSKAVCEIDRAQVGQRGDPLEVLEVLRSVVVNPAVDSRLRCAASEGMGHVLHHCVDQGLVEDDRDCQEHLQALQELLEQGPTSSLASRTLLIQGAILGISTLIAGPEAADNMKRTGSPLLTAAHFSPVTRDLVKSLEEAAAKMKDTRLSDLLWWVLADLSASARSWSTRWTTVQDKGDGPKPLDMYPGSGAMRPLTQAVLNHQGEATATLAAAFRCLGAAPRLPAVDWAKTCRQVAATCLTHETGGASELMEAVVRLALEHCASTSLGLTTWLTEVLQPGTFQRSPLVVQDLLLAEALPALVPCLAPRARRALLTSLPHLVTQGGPCTAPEMPLTSKRPAAGGTHKVIKDLPATRPLSCALWSGCRRMYAGAKGGTPMDESYCPEVLDLMRALLGALPLLPPMLPGEVLQMIKVDPELMQEASQHQTNSGEDLLPTMSWRSSETVLLWRYAFHCVVQLPLDFLRSVTLLEGDLEVQVRTVQLRCLLVLGGALPHEELTPCQALFMNLSPGIPHSDGSGVKSTRQGGGHRADPAEHYVGQLGDRLIVLLAMASLRIPHDIRARVVLDGMRALKVCNNPHHVVVMMAAMVAVWSAHTALPTIMDDHLYLSGPWLHGHRASHRLCQDPLALPPSFSSIIQALPTAFVGLVRDPRWSQGMAPVLHEFTLASKHPALHQEVRTILRTCVLSMRDNCQDELWHDLVEMANTVREG